MDARNKAQRERSIQMWLINKISAWVGIDPETVSIREPFESYGLSSVEAISMAGDLEEWLGRELSPILVYEYPTIEVLARHLAEEVERAQ